MENKMGFGNEPTEKKKNNCEYIEIFHPLLSDSFKDKLWINFLFCLNVYNHLYSSLEFFKVRIGSAKGERRVFTL